MFACVLFVRVDTRGTCLLRRLCGGLRRGPGAGSGMRARALRV